MKENDLTSWAFFLQLIRTEGPLTFYRGLNTNLFASVISYALYFWWYRFFKNLYYGWLGRDILSQGDIFMVSMLAGIISTLFTNPIWFINTRLIISKDHKGLLGTVKEVYVKEGGLKAFYKGVIPNLILVINPVINFVIYESLKKFLVGSNLTLSAFHIFTISLWSKSCSTFFTYPILTLRINLQASKSKKDVTFYEAYKILRNLGFRGLYVGVFTKFIHTIFYNATMMVIYEKLREVIRIMVMTMILG